MLNFKVRHVVPSSTGRHVLLGAFEGEAVIYDLVTGTLSGPFKLTFDFGGTRLALSDELDLILAGAYHRYGIAAYTVTSGQEIWRHKDLKRVQRIHLSRDGAKAYCGLEGQSLHVLDLHSGETITKIRGAQRAHENESGEILFLDSTSMQLQTASGKRLSTIPRTTFAVLDVCFAGTSICLTESGGPVRFLNTATGEELWRYQPPKNTHVLDVAYDKACDRIVGVQWPYSHGGSKQLIHLSASDGTLTRSLDIGQPSEQCFAMAARLLVLSDGRIIETSDGHTAASV